MARELEQARVEADVLAGAFEDDAFQVVILLCPPPLCGQSSRPSCPGKAENVLGAT
jgi:hypothetical protein